MRILSVIQNLGEMLAGRGIELDYVSLADVNLIPCTGCFACVRLGEDHCPLNEAGA